MSKALRISSELSLPLDTVVQRKAIIAKNRVGKSNLACAYVEEAHRHGVQSVVLDPKGDWYGIRSSADGKGPGLPFLVMGGDHGDVPLEPSAGAVLGEYFGSNHVDVVLDVSEFTKGQLARFGADFFEALYIARKKNRKPLNLVLEEAEDFAPQMVEKWHGPDMARCLGAVIKIAKKAGFLGIGLLCIAQRTASFNKNVLSQSDVMFFMRTTAPQDLKAAGEWLQNQEEEKRKEVLAHIQGLPTGSAHVWAPEAGIFQLVQLRRRATFDAGFTPKVGEAKPEPKVKAMVDLKALMGQMSDLVEKAKSDDPVELRARLETARKTIRELEERVKEAEARKPVVVEGLSEKTGMAMAVAIGQCMARLEEEAGAELAGLQERLRPAFEKAMNGIGSTLAAVNQGAIATLQASEKAVPASPRASSRPKHPSPTVQAALPLPVTGGARRMLDVMLAWPGRHFDRRTLGILGDMRSGTGGFNNALTTLRKHDPPLIMETEGQRLAASPAARDLFGKGRPESAAALRERWRGKFSGGARRMLEHLEAIYPSRAMRQELADAAGMAHGTGGFNNALSSLRVAQILDEDRSGVRLTPVLFHEGF